MHLRGANYCFRADTRGCHRGCVVSRGERASDNNTDLQGYGSAVLLSLSENRLLSSRHSCFRSWLGKKGPCFRGLIFGKGCVECVALNRKKAVGIGQEIRCRCYQIVGCQNRTRGHSVISSDASFAHARTLEYTHTPACTEKHTNAKRTHHYTTHCTTLTHAVHAQTCAHFRQLLEEWMIRL